MLCLSRYLYSHYDMPWYHEKRERGFQTTWWGTEQKERDKKACLLCQRFDLFYIFTLMPLHVIKKDNKPHFYPLPLFLFSFSHLVFRLFTFYIENLLASPPSAALLLFCAEDRWQKELCKRAFKTPKWLWSVHNGPKNAVLDKGRPLPRHSALQWWIRTDAWTWAGFRAVEAPPRPPLGQPKGTGLGDTLEPQSRASKQSQAAN